MIKPLALLREFEHVGARVTNSAEHPSVPWLGAALAGLNSAGPPDAATEFSSVTASK